MEEFVPFLHNNRYLVSNFGDIFDQERGSFVSLSPDKAGYLRAKLWIDSERKTYSVHRAVYESFYSCDISDKEINHLDGDKENNHLENLELTDRSGNMRHAFRSGSAKPVYQPFSVVCVETGQVFVSTGAADRHFEVSSGTVSKMIRGLQPTVRGFTFERV